MCYKYEVVRSARKTLAVSISPENKIEVRSPWGVSLKKIEEFVKNKQDWINKVVFENAKKLQQNNDIINYKRIYIGGVKFPLEFSAKNQITETCVYVKAIKNIKPLFIKTFAVNFIECAQKISEAMQLEVNSFAIKFYKGKWGCCDINKNIMFNYLLFMLPPELQRYVIVHEIVHTVCFNHSQAFWRLVERYEPDYRNLRKKLKSYDYLTGLYCKKNID